MDNEKLIKILNSKTYSEIILNNLEEESIDVYLFLKNELNKGKILDNFVFQFVFRSFYRLDNAGLSKELKKKYFEIMNKKDYDLKQILVELYDIKTLRGNNSVQLSFATKLLHSLNENLPIYDSKVAQVFNLKINGSKEKKIDSSIETYNKLKEKFNSILILKPKILEYFQIRYSNKKISDCKKLDFILWSLGDLIQKKSIDLSKIN